MSWEEQRRINLDTDARLRELARMLGRMPVRFSTQGGAAAEEKGQYQYMLHQMVTTNEDGWDFGRAHPIIEV